MRKHKNKIIIGTIIAIVLAFAFWWGGDFPMLQGQNADKSDYANINHSKTVTDKSKNDTNQNTQQDKEDTVSEKSDLSDIPIKKENEPATEENKPQRSDGKPMSASEKMALAEEMSGSSYTKQENAAENVTDATANSEKDVPVAEDKPVPIEPENTVISDKTLTCTMSVRCDTILKNIEWLDKEKTELVPNNGIIFAEQTVTFYEGESVFNLLVREMKRNKIHLEFENTPIYNSAYIEGIGNLYEFDCGELSGWMYKVNGWFPNYGCSRYQLKSGDKVEWVYTCDLGRDVGGSYSARNGK